MTTSRMFLTGSRDCFTFLPKQIEMPEYSLIRSKWWFPVRISGFDLWTSFLPLWDTQNNKNETRLRSAKFPFSPNSVVGLSWLQRIERSNQKRLMRDHPPSSGCQRVEIRIKVSLYIETHCSERSTMKVNILWTFSSLSEGDHLPRFWLVYHVVFDYCSLPNLQMENEDLTRR